MPKIAPPDSGDYPELPEKEWIEVKIKSCTPFMDTKFPNDDGSPKPRFEIIFEPTDPDLSSTRVWAYAGQSWHKKSNLRTITQATYSRELTDEELFEVDTDTLEGKKLLLMGKYAPEDTDHKFLKPTDYKRMVVTAKRGTAAKAAAPKAAEPEQTGEIDI